jgi:hypothetical protein
MVGSRNLRELRFEALYSWLDGRDMLIVKADRRAPLLVLPPSLAAEIAVRAK